MGTVGIVAAHRIGTVRMADSILLDFGDSIGWLQPYRVIWGRVVPGGPSLVTIAAILTATRSLGASSPVGGLAVWNQTLAQENREILDGTNHPT